MTELLTKIRFPEVTTRIHVGNSHPHLISRKFGRREDRRVFVVVDRRVLQLFRKSIIKHLTTGCTICDFPSGERHKNLSSATRLLAWLHDNHADRSSLLIAIGGGVVTDLVGFVASTYMRGIDYVAYPTTLVSQLDAAIGGKTAVNISGTKNIAGTFYPPSEIFCISDFLKTLKSTQIRDGLAEAMKIFAAKSSSLFDTHARKLPRYLAGDNLNGLILDAIRLKVEIVNRDPFEKDLRRVLNLGHTTGHAYEALTGQSHGKSVAFGFLVALELSRRTVGLQREDQNRISEAILQLYRRFSFDETSDRDLWEKIQHDKKRSGSEINFVLLKRCGEHVVRSINYRQFSAAIAATREVLEK